MTQKFPRIPYAEAIAKYGTDKPDLRNPIVMQDVSDIFRGSGLQGFRAHSRDERESRGVGDPGAGRRLARILRPDEFVGAGRRASRGLAISSLRSITAPWSAAAPSPTISAPERTEALRKQLGLKDGDAVFFVAGEPAKFRQVRGAGAHQDRRRARACAERPLRTVLDRRFPDVRVERGREEDRLLPQSVLDAELRRSTNFSRSTRPTRTRSSRSRRSSTTSSATAWNCPPARSAIIAPT